MFADRTSILNQLAAGQISAHEAAARLQPAPHSGSQAQAELAPAPRVDLAALQGRWLRIRVNELSTGKPRAAAPTSLAREKRNSASPPALRAAVNLPLVWVAAGMQIGQRYSADMPDINWGEVVAAVQSGASGRLIEVEDIEDNQRVEIYVE